ncbi:5-demethoxyubiquinone hydroxylase, mitochondrial-like [Dendronephthya gigantea]|uniref:5-demethoxyubiquinone hydroxylase, mitochondrial-like n=1 Tax=Dendronephthya gigantea TaxID=151771 RepID=UPI001069A1D2|nr:5-demethoxyubiquinone hydroxylase, mitochondrial-like [Dendronephthya gigantea]
MAVSRSVFFQLLYRPSAVSCRCLCTSAKRRRGRPDPLVDKILRVDHAGEIGANRIYAGQMAVLSNTKSATIIKEMWDQEKEHVEKFEELLPKYRVRPTALLPFWNVAGYALGAGSALLGEKAAMACTVAVEEVIGEHYDNQLRELLEDPEYLEKHKELLDVITKFRDDELEHLETGLDNDAMQAPFYSTMKNVIQLGCRTAIWLAEKI